MNRMTKNSNCSFVSNDVYEPKTRKCFASNDVHELETQKCFAFRYTNKHKKGAILLLLLLF